MNTSSNLKNEITEGVIWKQVLLFFFPILLGTFFQQFYNTVDAIVVGRFVGGNALAAVGGSSGQIINLILHKRLQRRDYYCQAMHGATIYQCRQLKRKRLTATRREYSKQRFTFNSSSHRHFLQRFSLVGTKLIITKKLL